MMLLTSLISFSLVLGVSSWFSFIGEAYPGAGDMWQVYSDMKEAGWKDSDKYLHVRGNYDAAQRGLGGTWKAEVISDAREGFQRLFSNGHKDPMADQEANRHGHSGKDPEITTDLLACLTNTEQLPISSGGCAGGLRTQPGFCIHSIY